MTGTYVVKSMKRDKYKSKRAKDFLEKEEKIEEMKCDFCQAEISSTKVVFDYASRKPQLCMGNMSGVIIFRNGQPTHIKHLCQQCLDRISRVVTEVGELGGFDKAKKNLCKKYKKKWWQFWKEEDNND